MAKKTLTPIEKASVQKLVSLERTTSQFENGALLSAYRKADREIQKTIESFYGKYAVDNKVSYANAVKALSNTERKQVNAVIAEYYDFAKESGLNSAYLNELRRLSRRAEVSRLQALQADIKYQIEIMSAANTKGMRELARTTYENAYYREIYDEAKLGGLSGSFSKVDTRKVTLTINQGFNGVNYSDSLWNNKDRLILALNQEVPQAFILGQSVQDLARTIRDRMDTSYSSAVRLARTETNRLNNQAALDSYEEVMDGDGEIQILATLDDRTSEICQEMDGQIIRLDEAEIGVTIPPFHPNCRTTMIRVFKESGVERLAKIDGVWERIADITFAQFRDAISGGSISIK